jgi:hypothetical protein
MSPPATSPTLITFAGQTVSTSNSGTFTLNSDMLVSSVSAISLPKGLSMKIWGVRVSGSAVVVALNFSKTVAGIASAVPHDVIAFSPTTGTPLFLEKNRPIVIPGLAGGESITATWSQAASTSNLSYLEIDAEFTDLSQ